jgi:rhamnosyl/mannosyltransferase
VVATAVGDVPRIVPPETGRVVPARDPDALAGALVDVLQRPWDPERIRATIAPFTWERFASETDAFLRGAVVRSERTRGRVR